MSMYTSSYSAFLVAQWYPPAMRETWVQSLGQEEPLEKEMTTHSRILARGNLMDRGAWQALQFMGSQSSVTEHKQIRQYSGKRGKEKNKKPEEGRNFRQRRKLELPKCTCRQLRTIRELAWQSSG